MSYLYAGRLGESEPQSALRLLAGLPTSIPPADQVCDFPSGSFAVRPVGAQAGPGFRRQGDLILVGDIRLDNQAQLQSALEQPAMGALDLVLAAHRRWGPMAPAHLYGDFSYALWDESAGSLLCARDYIGARPFYYAQPTSDGWLFGNDIELLLPSTSLNQQLDQDQVARFLYDNSYYPTRRTLYRNVHKLPPANVLLWKPGQSPLLHRYWFPSTKVSVPAAAAAPALAKHLEQAVSRRMVGVPVLGMHLSGGLDTAVLAAHVARLREPRQSLQAYAWSDLSQAWTDPYDERARLQAIAQLYDIPVQGLNLGPDDWRPTLQSDPARQSMFMLLCERKVQALAGAQSVSVILTGVGGDECCSFSGRGRLAGLLLARRWAELGRELFSLPKRPAYFYQWVLQPLRDRYWPPRLDWLAPPPVPLPGLPTREPADGPQAAETILGRLDFGHLAYRLESWTASGYRYGLEYRHPLLDRELVEFCLLCDPAAYYSRGQSRLLMRSAAPLELPHSLVWGPIKRENLRRPSLPEEAQQLGLPAELAAVVSAADLQAIRSRLQTNQRPHWKRERKFFLRLLQCCNLHW